MKKEEILKLRKEKLNKLVNRNQQLANYLLDQYISINEYIEACQTDIKKVIIILGSARGGTSVFKSIACEYEDTLALPGEHRPIFTLAGLNYPDHGGDSELSPNKSLSSSMRDYLLFNIYISSHNQSSYLKLEEISTREIDLYGWDWAEKLPLQWPHLELNMERIHDIVIDYFNKNMQTYHSNEEVFFEGLIHQFNLWNRDIYEEYYDHSTFKNIDSVHMYSSPLIIEISPFVILRPRKLPSSIKLPKALVIKASSDCYKLDLLKDLFKDFNRYYVHLTRNPLSSINGLIDGWNTHTFGQYDLSSLIELNQVEFSNDLLNNINWKFDLFPGWKETLSENISEIAALQWLNSHKQIVNFRCNNKSESFITLRFEDFQLGMESRLLLFNTFSNFTGLGNLINNDNLLSPKAINSTFKPDIRRWHKKRNLVVPFLNNMDIRSMCQTLDYNYLKYEEWI